MIAGRSSDTGYRGRSAHCSAERRQQRARTAQSYIAKRRQRARSVRWARRVLLIMVAGVACVLVGRGGGVKLARLSELLGRGAISTPKVAWAKGEMPYLYQTDSAWADHPYAGTTVKEAGCGPTALSMAYIYLTGAKDRDPMTMADLSEENGYVVDGQTAWSFMTEGAASVGLLATELPADVPVVKGELEQGHPIICSVGPGDFTTTGHFIVLSGIDDAGQIIIHDPNSAARSATTWDCARILAQCNNLWSYTQA